MIGRSVWFAAGAAAGVYATVKVRRVAEALTADGIRDRLNAVGVGARMMREEFAHGAAEAETELRNRYDAPVARQHAQQAQPALEAGLDTTPSSGPAPSDSAPTSSAPSDNDERGTQ